VSQHDKTHDRPVESGVPSSPPAGSLRSPETELFVAAKGTLIWLFEVIASGAVPDDPPEGTTDFCGLRKEDLLRNHDALKYAIVRYESEVLEFPSRDRHAV